MLSCQFCQSLPHAINRVGNNGMTLLMKNLSQYRFYITRTMMMQRYLAHSRLVVIFSSIVCSNTITVNYSFRNKAFELQVIPDNSANIAYVTPFYIKETDMFLITKLIEV